MKNIYLIPTDKPTRLYEVKGNLYLEEYPDKSVTAGNQHIYITSDEEIKEGDWFYDLDTEYVKIKQSLENSHLDFNGKKIILTTDQDLIKDGVQAIDDEFLEWFVKNPSCKWVSVELFPKFSNNLYGIIIPQEESVEKEKQKQLIIEIMRTDEELGLYDEPNQETLEEAAEDYIEASYYMNLSPIDFIKFGAKWQAQRMYSELFQWLASKDYLSDDVISIQKEFEQFKKK